MDVNIDLSDFDLSEAPKKKNIISVYQNSIGDESFEDIETAVKHIKQTIMHDISITKIYEDGKYEDIEFEVSIKIIGEA